MIATMGAVAVAPFSRPAAAVASDRLYTLRLKSMAVPSGLRSTGRVMAFPRSLPELGTKSAEFCAEDRSTTVGAGVPKERPVGACNSLAMADR
jgi:hypothetical protein